jgi:hypothetical protein
MNTYVTFTVGKSGRKFRQFINFQKPGTDVTIFTIFSPKILAKNWRFLLKTKLNYAKS